MSALLTVFLVASFLVAWLLPLTVAVLFRLPWRREIAILSVVLGWTGVAWLAALVIAVGGAAARAGRPAPPSGAASPSERARLLRERMERGRRHV